MVDRLVADYRRFPTDQSFDLYAADVKFQDPLNSFHGIQRYREMIELMATWMQDIQMDLHEIQRDRHQIRTRWTLHFTAPLPWRPRVSIPGTSRLEIGQRGDRELIVAHIDVWDISRWQALRQVFQS